MLGCLMRSVPVHPAAALEQAELPLRQLLGGYSLHQRISFRVGGGGLIFFFLSLNCHSLFKDFLRRHTCQGDSLSRAL